MAITLRHAPRRGHFANAIVGLGVLAAIVAVVPVVFALVTGTGSPVHPRTAFASAPPGQYIVVSRTEGDIDVVAVAPASDPGQAEEVARVPHLAGFSTSAEVSPDGRSVAVVSPDSGTATQPLASVLVLDLDSGETRTVARNVDALGAPVWSPNAKSIVVTRTAAGASGAANVQFVAVDPGGAGEDVIQTASRVLGGYAVGFDAQGRLLAVIIDGRGSTLTIGGSDVLLLSDEVTRDWRLSPDGKSLAFIESNLDGGLHYVARVVSIGGGEAAVQAQVANAGQSLGVAWSPKQPLPTFGQEHTALTSSGAEAEVAADADSHQVTGGSGFDVPLGYSTDGSVLAVDHWTGGTFANPGTSELQLVSGLSRIGVPNYSRLVGWSAR